eukprot:7378555-Prymnesium_polylepis.1
MQQGAPARILQLTSQRLSPPTLACWRCEPGLAGAAACSCSTRSTSCVRESERSPSRWSAAPRFVCVCRVSTAPRGSAA